MTDDEARVVLALVRVYLTSEHGCWVDVSRSAEAEEFLAFIEKAWRKLDHPAHPSNLPLLEDPRTRPAFMNGPDLLALNDDRRADLRVTAMMCLLGPESGSPGPVDPEDPGRGLKFGSHSTRTIPPCHLRRALLDMVNAAGGAHAALRMERIPELAIAFGCGSGRRLAGGADTWDAEWPGALHALAQCMERSARRVDHWLKDRLVHYRDQRQMDRRSAEAEALLMAMMFCHPETQVKLDGGQSLRIGDIGGSTSAGPRYRVVDGSGAQQHATNDLEDAQAYIEGQPNAPHLGIIDTSPAHAPGEAPIWQDFDTSVELPGEKSVVPLQPGCRYVLRTSTPACLSYPTKKGPQQVEVGPETLCSAFAREDVTTIRVDPGPPGKVVVKEFQQMALAGPCSLRVYECTCGDLTCREKHRLSGWHAGLRDNGGHLIRLWSFVDWAVKGPPARGPGDGLGWNSIRQGMYAPLLSWHEVGQGRLRQVPVEVTQADGRKATEEYFILDGIWPPPYQRQLRVRCVAGTCDGACGNLLEIPAWDEIKASCLCRPHAKQPCEHEVVPSPQQGDDEDLLRRFGTARLVDLRRQDLCRKGRTCPVCGHAVTPPEWGCTCVPHRHVSLDDKRTLAARPTTVWVRIQG